jgi:glycosyltransferase involved in cell wall biosynthesis
MSHPPEDSPEVSVIIPAYRAAGDIARALDSVFGQTFSSVEVIVINDGSPDTPALKEALAPYVSCIRYIEFTRNRGAAVARNAGISAARGRYLAFLDADDCWHPEFLEGQVAYLETEPHCTLVYADAAITGESPLAGQRFMEGAPSNGPVTFLSLVEERCNVILSTVVARREAIARAGMFDEDLRRGQDFDLWLRLVLKGATIRYRPLVLAERRVRATGLSGDAVAELERVINVLDRFGHRHMLDAPTRTALRMRTTQLIDRLEIERAKQRMLEGDFAAAQHHLSASRERSLKIRLAMVGMRIAPRLVCALYARARTRSVPTVARSMR